jgi:hypothetical protein
MTIELLITIIGLSLLVALVVFFAKNRALTRTLVEYQAEVAAAQQATARVRAEAERSLNEAQKLIDVQLAELRADADRVRQHYEGEARRITEAAQAQLAKAKADLESLRRFASLGDAEAEVRQTLEAAMEEAGALRGQARTLLEQTRAASETERLKATERAKEIYEQADARLDQATRDAGRIVSEAEKRAKEIAGEAYDALRDKQLLERAAEAVRNIIEGYGDRYIIPTHSILDDLAAEFGYTSAGESLKSARAQCRRMVEQGEAATCEYVEANRRETAIRFVIDAFNGRVDAILTRVRRDNHGQLEPHRVCRRLHYLRGWGHGETKQVFPRGSRAGGADGSGAPGRPRFAVGGGAVDREQDRLHGGDVAAMAAAG